MTDKPKTKAELEKTLLRANNTIAKLRKQLERANTRVAELETAQDTLAGAVAEAIEPREEIVTVAVGPVMPWETALPNSFKVT
jgi:hypothetical protein